MMGAVLTHDLTSEGRELRQDIVTDRERVKTERVSGSTQGRDYASIRMIDRFGAEIDNGHSWLADVFVCPNSVISGYKSAVADSMKLVPDVNDELLGPGRDAPPQAALERPPVHRYQRRE